MEFEWDEAKLIFAGPILTRLDKRQTYGEVREISVGGIGAVAVLAIIHTDREGRIRLISARRATRKERKVYHEYIGQASE